jgi:hypothetical protein
MKQLNRAVTETCGVVADNMYKPVGKGIEDNLILITGGL